MSMTEEKKFNVFFKRTFEKKNIILLLIIAWSLLFVISIFFITTKRFFITRYEQVFVSFITSKLFNSDSTIFSVYGSFFPLITGFFMFVINFTNLDVLTLIQIPFGLILFPISIYLFVKEIFSDFSKESILGVFYLFFYYFYTKFFQVGYVAAFGIPIVLHFTVCLLKILKQENSKKYIVLALIEIVYLVGLWHSAAFYAIVLFGSLTIIYLILVSIYSYKKWKSKSNSDHFFLKPKVALFSFSAIAIVGFFVINSKSDLLGGYLGDFTSRFTGEGGFIGGILSLFTPIINRLFGKSDLPLANEMYEYNYVSTLAGKFYFIAHIAILLISTFILLICLVILIRKIKKDSNNIMIIWLVFVFSLFLAQIIYYFLYSGTGSNLFYIAIMFPIFGVFLLKKLGYKKFATISMITIFSLGTVMSFSSISTNQFGYNIGSSYEDNFYGFNWLNNHSDPDTTIYFDFNLHGRYLQYNIENNVSINWTLEYIDSTNYLYITGNETPPSNFDSRDLVVIDLLTLENRIAFDTYEKRGLLISELELINQNPNLAMIYNDRLIAIYSFI
ncbi:MAG TPA: hypothetical protein VMZ29_13865 [Candidatus Bathyarchaeia archaeon]|nr:hypothetical protein [Candidatus Bathyarchaeia archaeon]